MTHLPARFNPRVTPTHNYAVVAEPKNARFCRDQVTRAASAADRLVDSADQAGDRWKHPDHLPGLVRVPRVGNAAWRALGWQGHPRGLVLAHSDGRCQRSEPGTE